MRKFKSAGHAQSFLSSFGPIAGHFQPRRNRMSAKEYRAGVSLSTITPEEIVQPDLFNQYDAFVEDTKRCLMKLVDEVNAQWPGALFFAAKGITRQWRTKQRFLSPKFTTRWTDLLVVT